MNANTTVILSDDIEDFFAGIMEGRSIRDAAWGAGLDPVQGVEVLRSAETRQKIIWLASAVAVALADPETTVPPATAGSAELPAADNVIPFRR
jgi:hypothetical protein